MASALPIDLGKTVPPFPHRNVSAVKGAIFARGDVPVPEGLASPTAAAAVRTITARPITVTAQTDTKIYDSTDGSAVAPLITSGSLAGSDSAGFAQTFDTRNVGTGKRLRAAGVVSDGNGGGNYNVTFVDDNTGSITARALTITAQANSKTYDTSMSSAPP